MNQLDQINESINNALELSDVFVKLHGFSSNNESISIKDEDHDIILPYLFFNPKYLGIIPKSPHILFRLSYMRELFEANIDDDPSLFDKLPSLFEECQSPFQKITFLRRDLAIIEERNNNNNENNSNNPKFLNLLQYSQYISDCLPILYARLYSSYKLSTFISVAFGIGENAIKSFCFCFPNVIFPVFRAILIANSTEMSRNIADSAVGSSNYSLLINIVTISPNHRPLLHPKLLMYPLIFSLLAIKFFKEESPLIILSSIQGCYPEIKPQLLTIAKQGNLSPSFYKLYARCCSVQSALDNADYDILKGCKDDKLIICTLFNIDQTQSQIFSNFLQNFSRNSSSMSFLFDLIYDLKEKKNDDLSYKIKNVLGDDYDWQVKHTFYNYFCTSLKNIELKSSFLGTDLDGLKIFSWLIDESETTCSFNWLPNIIFTLTKVDVNAFHYLLVILNFIKTKKIEDFKLTIEQFMKDANKVFELQKVAKNPAPAIAVLFLLLEAEKIILHQTNSFDLSLINKLPLRFVICCASQFENCSSIFYIISKLCNSYAGHVFYQSPYMTLSPEYLLSKGNSEEFLIQLADIVFKKEFHLITEDTYADWMIHRFISPYQYVVDTIYALGGPLGIEQLHQIFEFPKEVLRNKFLAKIIFICLIDIVALYEKIYPHSEKEKSFNGSVVLVLHSAFDLLKDPLIDSKAVFNFINDLFYISPWIFKTLIVQGCDVDLIHSITHGATFFNDFMDYICQIINQYANKNMIFALQFTFELADAYRNSHLNAICREILKSMYSNLKVNDNNAQIVIDSLLKIYRIFPDLYVYVNQMLTAIKNQLSTQNSNPNIISVLDLAFNEITSYSFAPKL